MKFLSVALVLSLAACGGEYTDVEQQQLDPYAEAAEYGACMAPAAVCSYYVPGYISAQGAEGCSHSIGGITKVNGCLSSGTDYTSTLYNPVNVNCAAFTTSPVTYQMPGAGHCYWKSWYYVPMSGYFTSHHFSADTSSCTGTTNCLKIGLN